VTVSDPAAYTRDWKATWTLRWVGGEEFLYISVRTTDRSGILSHSEYVRD
jgi:hypothetical protein